ncbi:hypothetical protein [Clostridium neonatale]|uniref:Uncharacterized protein n=1 Tax=Clostridium neonatale TaxID=137838 RepID=A0AAD2DHT5_9CLOT|nr:hypothetical protein [Clostridium neonatale]MBP8312801.1 hypothetical protein [Clostridium neonatale]CAI3195306.1 hypothetical protein CNEO2_1300019 [Clostridium neonatale]CAI3214046.1 hypothetical protein CNEO2_960006 [Clostridium neonatale]CAI3216191.1 hypothetical protein CNEO2_960019 [Clostridium neonatale]CAI3216729.1 hypothetical protein CNEO2_1030019 [Clostridium neonatale]
MVSYAPFITCDLSGKTVELMDSRIEWGYGANSSSLTFLHICANDCCVDYTRGPYVGGDITFYNTLYSENPEFVFERLQELAERYPDYASEFNRISDMIFIEN